MAISEELVLSIDSALAEIGKIDAALQAAAARFTVDLAQSLNAVPLNVTVQVNVDQATLTSAVTDALSKAAGDAPVVVQADTAALTAEIQQAVSAIPTTTTVSVDADTTTAQQTIGALDGQTITETVEVDTTAAAAAIDELAQKVADLASAGGQTTEIIPPSTVPDLDAAGTSAKGAKESFDALGSSVDALSIGAAGLDGNVKPLFATLGEAGVAAGALAAATKILTGDAVDAASAEQRLELAAKNLGVTLDQVTNLSVGGLDQSLKDISLTVGTSLSQLKGAEATFLTLGQNAGFTSAQTTDFAASLSILAERSVALNPNLGSVADVMTRLNQAFSTGRQLPADYQIAMIPLVDINARATEIFGKQADELNRTERAYAAAQLQIEKLGPALQSNVEEGAQNVIFTFRNLQEQLTQAFQAIGQPLIGPVSDLLKTLEPVAETLAQDFADLLPGLIQFTTVLAGDLLPILQALDPIVRTISETFSILSGVLNELPPVIQIVAASLLALLVENPVVAIAAGIIGLGQALGLLGNDAQDATTKLAENNKVIAEGRQALATSASAFDDYITKIGQSKQAQDALGESFSQFLVEASGLKAQNEQLAAAFGVTFAEANQLRLGGAELRVEVASLRAEFGLTGEQALKLALNGETVTSAFGKISEAIQGTLGPLSQFIGTPLGPTIDKTFDSALKLSSALEASGGNIEGISKEANAARDAFQGWVTSIDNVFTQLGKTGSSTEIVQTFNAQKGVLDELVKQYPELQGVAASALQRITSDAEEALRATGELPDPVRAAADEFDNLDSKLTQFSDDVKELVNGIDLDASIRKITDAAVKLGAALIESGGSFTTLSAAGRKAADELDTVEKDIAKSFETIGSTQGQEAALKFLDDEQAKLSSLTDKFPELASKVDSFFGQLRGAAGALPSAEEFQRAALLGSQSFLETLSSVFGGGQAAAAAEALLTGGQFGALGTQAGQQFGAAFTGAAAEAAIAGAQAALRAAQSLGNAPDAANSVQAQRDRANEAAAANAGLASGLDLLGAAQEQAAKSAGKHSSALSQEQKDANDLNLTTEQLGLRLLGMLPDADALTIAFLNLGDAGLKLEADLKAGAIPLDQITTIARETGLSVNDLLKVIVEGDKERAKAAEDAAKAVAKAHQDEQRAIESLAKAYTDNLPKISDAFKDLDKERQAAAKAAIDGLGKDATDVEKQVAAATASAKVGLGDFLADVEANTQKELDFFQTIQDLISKGAVGLADAFLKQGISAADLAKQADELNAAGLAQAEAVIDKANQAQTAVDAQAKAFAQNAIQNATEGAAVGIEAAATNLHGKANVIGGEIASGAAEGVTKNKSLLSGAIEDMGQEAIDTLKRVLGIQSPSTVFAELGRFSIEGYNAGLGDPQKLAELQATANKVKDTAVIPPAIGSIGSFGSADPQLSKLIDALQSLVKGGGGSISQPTTNIVNQTITTGGSVDASQLMDLALWKLPK